jgi:NAD(P)-dependent dehydrogenase (short-subunit alcohol dehydrogenase family)
VCHIAIEQREAISMASATKTGGDQPLAGSVALVTGGASGIGRATVVGLADKGCDVGIVDLAAAAIEEVASEVRGKGRRALEIVADLSDAARVSRIVEEMVDGLGRLDILVNSAGVTGFAGLLDCTLEDWERHQAVNIRAPFLLMQAAAHTMISQGDGGRIISVSSSSAFRARSVWPAYGASKTALIGLTRSAAWELGRHGINVNVVAPGATATPMGESYVPGGRKELEEMVAGDGPTSNLLGRLSEPEDVANAITFLCLPESRQITAQVIHTSAGAIV